MKVFSQLEKAQLENTAADVGTLPKGMVTYRTDLNVAKVSNGTVMKELVDTDSVQTVSAKTLVTPTIQQVTTPSNPAAGFNKLYFKSDEGLYKLTSTGVETLLSAANTAVQSKIANYTLLTTDFAVKANASAGAFTLTLPTAAGNTGLAFRLSRTDQTLANIVTIATTSAQTIGAYGTTVTLATQDETWVVYSDGANWLVASHTYPSVWTSFVPVVTGLGTVSNEGYFWKRSGDALLIKGTTAIGTVTATTLSVSLPSGLVVDATKNPSSTNSSSHGRIYNTTQAGSYASNAVGPFPVFSDTSISSTVLYVAFDNAASRFQKANGSTIFLSLQRMRFESEGLPITNWKG